MIVTLRSYKQLDMKLG